MKSIDSYRSFYQQIEDIQALTHKMSMPWLSAFESASKSIQSLNFDTLSEAMRAYSSLADLYCLPDYLASSDLFRVDSVEDQSIYHAPPVSDTTHEESTPIVSYNTNAEDINKVNEDFMKYLEFLSDDFLRVLARIDFEDGMDNEITCQVSEYMERNRYVTYCWLNKLFNEN